MNKSLVVVVFSSEKVVDLLLDEAGVTKLVQSHLVILVDLHLLEHPFCDVFHVVSRHPLHVVKC